MRSPSLEVSKQRSWLSGLQSGCAQKRHEVPPRVQGGHDTIQGSLAQNDSASPESCLGEPGAPSLTGQVPLLSLHVCPLPTPPLASTSSLGTPRRRNRQGGSESGWRLNRKREWGFPSGRQGIINLLINRRGPSGRGKGLPTAVLRPPASPESKLGVSECQTEWTVGPVGRVFCHASPHPLAQGHSPPGGGVGARAVDAAQTGPHCLGWAAVVSFSTQTVPLRRRGREERACFKKALQSGTLCCLAGIRPEQQATQPERGGRRAGGCLAEGNEGGRRSPGEFRQTPLLSTSGKGWL